jgi:hypothetical protein
MRRRPHRFCWAGPIQQSGEKWPGLEILIQSM